MSASTSKRVLAGSGTGFRAARAHALQAAIAEVEAAPPPIEAGIRITATTITLGGGLPTASVSTAGVFDSGQFVNQLGGGAGYLTSFTGYTNDAGYDDHDAAVTNAYWNLYADYSAVSACGLASDLNQLVPLQRNTYNSRCILAVE
ncbi:MAG: hypothetical protein ACRD1C_08250 [Terriglobales bacterium]